jgi:hypothetical protein
MVRVAFFSVLGCALLPGLVLPRVDTHGAEIVLSGLLIGWLIALFPVSRLLEKALLDVGSDMDCYFNRGRNRDRPRIARWLK